MLGPLGQVARLNIANLENGRKLTARIGVMLAACALAIAPAGCLGIKANDARLRHSIEDGWEQLETAPRLNVSPATTNVLIRHGLYPQAREDPASAVRALDAELQSRTEPDGALALAELSYHVGVAGKRDGPSWRWPGIATRPRSPRWPSSDPAGTQPEVWPSTIHNRAVARLIRLAETERVRLTDRRSWREILERRRASWFTARPDTSTPNGSATCAWRAISGRGDGSRLSSGGLGVPLVAHRFGAQSGSPDRPGPVLPAEMRIAATAVLRPGGGLIGGDWRRNPATIELLDPFQRAVGRRRREGRRSSPPTGRRRWRCRWLAGNSPRSSGPVCSTRTSSSPGVETGLYMLRPYEPGKIPVVFVHGLFSSPRAWVQTINELQNTPAIASRYQFWLFIYPTGQPIPGSAARLRQSLVRARGQLDPSHSDTASTGWSWSATAWGASSPR